MTTIATDTLTVAIIDGHRLTDDGLRRVAAGCTSVVSMATEDRSFTDVEARWARLAPGLAIEDGGRVGSVRDAIVECARRGVLVMAAPAPRKAGDFVAQCLQGAAAATEFDVPGIAVHVVRDQQRPGSVAWISDTGELSGYGVLFAVGYAAAHGVGVELIEPTGGLDAARTPDAVDDALARAEEWGVPLTRHSDPSPMARVLRDEHSLVVHPVLDAPGGFNLMHPGHLPHKAVASGSPAAVVELIERFPGDVVAVYDAVHILHGQVPAARIAAAAALGVVTISGVGIAIAGPASAATTSGQDAAAVAVDVDARSAVEDAVFGLRFSLVSHHGSTDLQVRNTSGHSVVLAVSGYHGHGGSHAVDFVHEIPAGGSYTFSGGSGVKTWSTGSIVGIDGYELPGLQVMAGGHFVPPPYADILDMVGVMQPQHPPVVTQGPGDITSITDTTTPGPTTITAMDGPTLTTPGGGQGPVTGPGGATTQVQGQAQVDVPPQPSIAVPQVPTLVTPPDVPQAVPDRLVEPPQPPIAVPQVPTVVTPPDVPQAVPDRLVEPPQPPVLVPQVPTQQGPVQGPTVTPPVQAPVDVPTLVPQLDAPSVVTPGGGGGPIVGPSGVTSTVVSTPLEQPPLPSVVPGVDIGTPTDVAGSAVTPTQIGDPVSTQIAQDLDSGTVAPGGGIAGGHGMSVVRPPASTDGGGLIVDVPDGDHAPAGELAHTGANVALLGGVAAALIAAGAGLAVMGRKKAEDG